MKKAATLLFLDRETIPIVRDQTEASCEFDIRRAVTLRGWGIRRVSDIDDRGCVEHLEMYDIEDTFEVGALLIIKPHRYCDFEQHVLPFVKRNIKTIEMVVCSWEEGHKSLKQLCEVYGIEYRNLTYEHCEMKARSHQLLQLRTPVIYVTGLSEMSDKCVCQQKLVRHFMRNGYRVESVGTKVYSALLGWKAFPSFMFDHTLSGSQKIIEFNHYLKEIESQSVPDLIIVGIPGEIDGFVNGISECFDEMPYLTAKAAAPDVVVLSALYGEVKDAGILQKILKYRYGWELEHIFINNMMYDPQLSLAYKRKEYVKLNHELVEKEVAGFNEPPGIHCYSYDQLELMCGNIEDQLAEFGNENIV